VPTDLRLPVAALVLCVAGILAPRTLGIPEARAALTPTERYSSVTRTMLELEGTPVGMVYGWKGGNAVAEVATVRSETSPFPTKQITRVRFEPIQIEFGIGMDRRLCDWVSNAVRMQGTPARGSLVNIDSQGRVTSALDFEGASVSEVTFPALEASTDPARMIVTLVPSTTRRRPGSGATYPAQSPVTTRTERWLRSTFRLNLPGLERASQRISKIEALTIKLPIPTDKGSGKTGPSGPEISNLVVTVLESYAEPLYRWHEDFVIRGQNGPEREQTGVLEWLSQDQKTTLGSLELSGVGIVSVARDDADSTLLSKVRAEMYCEALKANLTGLARGGSTAVAR
jgi:hypothetical protein